MEISPDRPVLWDVTSEVFVGLTAAVMWVDNACIIEVCKETPRKDAGEGDATRRQMWIGEREQSRQMPRASV